MSDPRVPLWQAAEWPESQLADRLKSWSTSGGQRTVIVTLDTDRGGCGIYCRGGTRDEVRAFLAKSKREELSMAEIFAGLEAWRSDF